MNSKRCSKENCPSGFRLDVYCAGESDELEKERLSLHIDACERCQLEVEQRRQGFSAFGASEQAYLARFRNRLEEHDKRRAASTDVARPENKGWSWLLGWKSTVGVLATAGLALIVILSPKEASKITNSEAQVNRNEAAGVRAKGAAGFEVFMSRDGRVEQVADDATLRTGDRLRFRVTLSRDRELMVVGQEQSGQLYPVATTSARSSLSLKAGSRQLLEQTIELDDSQGREALHLVSCDSPFDFDQVQLAGKELESPQECSISSLFFEKLSRETP